MENLAENLFMFALIGALLFGCIAGVAQVLTGQEVKKKFIDIANTIFNFAFIIAIVIVVILSLIEFF